MALPRNGPGRAGLAELLGRQRDVEQLETRAAVRRRNVEPGDAELGESAPERRVVAASRSP